MMFIKLNYLLRLLFAHCVLRIHEAQQGKRLIYLKYPEISFIVNGHDKFLSLCKSIEIVWQDSREPKASRKPEKPRKFAGWHVP